MPQKPRIFAVIDYISDLVAKIFMLLIFPITLVLFYDVFSRYFLSKSTIWAGELGGMLFGVYLLMGGSYALQKGAHVSVDIFYTKFSPRTRAAVDIVTWTMFYIFVLILLYKGWQYASLSIGRMEKTSSLWGPYTWPSKIFIPIAAFLMLLQGIKKTYYDLVILMGGPDFNDYAKSEGEL